jgi:hypothetical protein
VVTSRADRAVSSIRDHGRMIKVQTTVVAVIGPPGQDPLAGVEAANVRVVRTGPDRSPLDRAVVLWEEARRTTSTWLLHDADPLAAVAEAWVRRFDGPGVTGELEVAVAEVLARWRGRSLDLPDHYLVVDAEGLGPTWRHWYLGVLGAVAPTRVLPAHPAVPLLDHLADLRPGPWWPDLDEVIAGIDRVLPEQSGTLATAGPARLVEL